MGKKSKGRAARRAAAEESRAISFVHGLRDRYTRSLRWEFAACTHGVNPVAIPEGSACRGLIDTFLDAFFDDKANEKFEKTGEVFANAMEQTYESHREVWDSESGRQLIIADLLRRGAEILLRVDSVAKKREADRGRLIGLAGAYATVVDAIETYCPEKARATVWTHPKHPMPGGGFQINPDMSAEEVEEMTLQMTRLGCESKEVGVNACYSYGSKEREKKADSELVSLLRRRSQQTQAVYGLPAQILKRPRPSSPEPYANAHPHSQLPAYLSEVFSDLYAQDGLAVLGRGLGWLELLCTFVRYYGDRSEEGYAASKAEGVAAEKTDGSPTDNPQQGRKCPLIFVLGLREDERRVLQSTLASWGTPTDELPQIVVAESSAVTERAAMYARGGVFVVTSRILIVDLLQGTANARDIEGMLVAHAEKVDGESTEAFILRIFRNHRNFMGGGGGFIKAFTDDPAQLISGFAKVDKILKSLQVQKMYLYPRFHAAVAEELERQPPTVFELHQPLSESMKKIQLNLTACMRACMRDMRAKAGGQIDFSFLFDAHGDKGKRKRDDDGFDYDPNAKRSRAETTQDWKLSIQQCISSNFGYIIRRQLEGNFHHQNRDVKQSLGDLNDLSKLYHYLIEYDCVQFYRTLQAYKNKSAASKYQSYWMMQPCGEDVFKLAKGRVFRVVADPTKRTDGKLKQVLEEKPKERLLHQVLTEVQNRWNAKQQKAMEEGCQPVASGNVLVMVKDHRVLESVETFLATSGGKLAAARHFLKYLDQVNERTRPMLGPGGHTVETLQTEQRLLFEEHSKVRKVVVGDGYHKEVLEKDKKKLVDWKKKHRRVIEEKARGMATADNIRQQGLMEEAVEEAMDDAKAPPEMMLQNEGMGGGSEDGSADDWSSEDENELAYKVEPIEGLSLFVRTFSNLGEGEASILLNDLQPGTVIMYDSDPSFIRSLEIYSNSMGDPTSATPLAEEDRLQVFFLRYEASAESITFDKKIEREKDAFERLIDASKRMPTTLPSFNNFSTQEMQQARGGAGGSYAGGSLPLSMDTRTGGGKQNVPKERRDIAVDVREFRSPLPSILHQGGMRLAPVQLTVGDFVLSNVHCVERKSLSDLYQSFASGRLYNQAEIMGKYYKCPCLLIEFDPRKTFSLQSKSDIGGDIRKDSIGSKLTMLTMEFPKLRLLWSKSFHETLKIFKRLKQNHQEVDVDKAVEIGTNEALDGLLLGGEDGYYNEDDNDGANDAAKQMLLRLPGVNVHNARKIMGECDSIAELSEMSREELRRIAGPVAGQKLFTFFRKRFAA
ncbi:hypothetical protein ACHAXT_000283 [Thalassiosira profunda]